MREWIERIRRFFAEVTTELKRTTWPGRVEVRGTTIVVIITVFVFAVFLFAVDLVLGTAVQRIFDYFSR